MGAKNADRYAADRAARKQAKKSRERTASSQETFRGLKPGHQISGGFVVQRGGGFRQRA